MQFNTTEASANSRDQVRREVKRQRRDESDKSFSAIDAPRLVDEHGYRHSLVRGTVVPPFLNEQTLVECQQNVTLKEKDIVSGSFEG